MDCSVRSSRWYPTLSAGGVHRRAHVVVARDDDNHRELIPARGVARAGGVGPLPIFGL